MTFALNITTPAERKEAAREQALESLASLRWATCEAGVTLPNGMQVPGDDNTRLALSGAVSALDKGMISAPVAWKTPTGFVALSQAEVEAAAASIAQHIQRCFDAEGEVASQIASAADPAGLNIAAAFASALEAE